MSIPSPVIEQAHSVSLGGCPCGQCGLIVGYLRDESGEAFAAFSFTPDGARGLIADIEATLDVVAPAGTLTGIRCEDTA